MSARTAASWQTSLADLSLILFMISAAAISRQQGDLRQEKQAQAREVPPSSPEGTPLAIYIAASGAPPLARWLSEQAGDPRQRVTVTSPYGPDPGDMARSLAEAGRLAADAEAAGHKARIVVEPGLPPARVALAFDEPDDAMARSLRTLSPKPGEGSHSR
ncbi:MAG: hypothetical protein J7530_01055 [Novosphingobium sp.]|nr:hypothetical protein [Novosphingobium sp.]